MCSDMIVHTKKATIKRIVGRKEPRKPVLWKSILWPTPADYVNHFNTILDKASCTEFVDVHELSVLLKMEISTIYNYNCKHTERLPERVKGRKDLVWRVSATHKFMSGEPTISAPPPPPPAPMPMPMPAKRGPGRPTSASKSEMGV